MKQFPTAIKLLLFFVFLIFFHPVFAQVQNIKGKVFDAATNTPLEGATILVKRTNASTFTSGNGEFSITAENGDEITVTSIGYEMYKAKVNGDFINVAITASTQQLGDVVVTALGVRKESKRLGYAVQEVKGADLVKAREPNPINGLVGKVAGLTVGMSAEMMQGPQLILRGRGINLFVVDGAH